jgi:hypothetical protein
MVLACVVLIPCVMNGVMNHVYRCEQCARNPYDSALVLGVIALGLLFDLFVLLYVSGRAYGSVGVASIPLWRQWIPFSASVGRRRE